MVPWTLSYNLDFCNILQAYSNRTSDGTNMPEGENQPHKSRIFSPGDDATQLSHAFHCHSCTAVYTILQAQGFQKLPFGDFLL